MLPEIRARASEILAGLQKEALHPTTPHIPAWPSYASQAEATIGGCLNKLSALGQPALRLGRERGKES